MMSLPSVSNSEQKFPFTQTNFAAVGQPVPSRGSAPRRPHRGLPDRGGGWKPGPLPTLRGRPCRGGAGEGRRDRLGPSRPERRTNGGGGRGRGSAGPGRAGAGLRGAARLRERARPGGAVPDRERTGAGAWRGAAGGHDVPGEPAGHGRGRAEKAGECPHRGAGGGQEERSECPQVAPLPPPRGARCPRGCCGTAGGAPGAASALFRPCPIARSARTEASVRRLRPLGRRFPAARSAPCAMLGGTRCPPCATRAPGLCFPLARLQQPSPPRPPASCGHPGAPGAASCRPRSVPILGLNCCGRPGMGALVGRRSPLAQPGGGSGLRPSRGSALGSCFGT